MPKEFITKNGFKILVGKDSRENDYLTHTLAKSSDYFFHVSDFPGAHVILITAPDRAVLASDLEEAARLAHQNSKAKNRNKVNVDYALISNVSRPKGSKSGEVELTKFKTIKIR